MTELDAVIIGAGMSGMYQLHTLRARGLSVLAIEAGSEVGGTWYWNRYPGCRFDSESYTYGYSFSKELLDEWHWTERFSSAGRIDAVVGFLEIRIEAPFGLECAAAVLHDDGVPGLGHAQDVTGQEQQHRLLLVVGETQHDHGIAGRSRGSVHVRREADPVAHRYRQVFIDRQLHCDSPITVSAQLASLFHKRCHH